jgi:segregation and condensation protein B
MKQESFDSSVTLQMVLEALAFATDVPVSAKEVCRVYAEVVGEACPPSEAAIDEAFKELNDSYEIGGHTVRIQYWAGGLRMTTTESVAPFLEAFFRRERRRHLTKPLMETLAIVAYKQPATKAEIDAVRGVDSGYALRKLLELNLLAIFGRADILGRPMLYATTERFLEEFGLKDLDELPNLRQAEELLGDTAFDEERVRLLMAKGLDMGDGDPSSTKSESKSKT